jgi:hypothetical protein
MLVGVLRVFIMAIAAGASAARSDGLDPRIRIHPPG